MLLPFRTSAGRRPIRARITPSHTAAASSKPTPTGLCASAALSGMQTNSACAPNVQALTPKTSSPALNSVTAGPAASTTPASSLPRIRCRGRRRPVSRRATGGLPRRVSVSDRLTVVARILIRTWSRSGDGPLDVVEPQYLRRPVPVADHCLHGLVSSHVSSAAQH